MGEPKVLLLGTQKKENEYAFSDQSIGYAVDEFFLHKYGVSYYTYNKSMLEEVTELEVLKAENLSELSKMPYITKLTLKGGDSFDLRVLEGLPLLKELHLLDITAASHQARKLVSACEDSEIYIPILLALMLGLRRGEVLGLQWQDIDFYYRTLSVCRSAGWLHGEFVLSETKTRNSRRTLMLSDMIIDALKAHRTLQSTWEEKFGEGFNQLNL
jgi:integrase